MAYQKMDPLDADEERKPACPGCGGCTIHRLTGRHDGSGPRWWCDACSASFQHPTYRVPEHTTPVERPHISPAGRAAIEWEPEE